MIDYLIFAATVIIFLIIAVIYLYPGSKKSTSIPGPEPVDALEGNFPDIKASGSLHEFLQHLHESYGQLCSFWAGPQLCVSIASPELFEEQSNSFDRPADLFKAPVLLWGDNSSFILNGAEGRKKHAFMSQMFNNKYIDYTIKFNHELMKKHIALWMKWPQEQYFPLFEKISGFVAKSLMATMLGYDVENLPQEIITLKRSLDNVWIEVDHYIDDAQDVDGLRELRLQQYKKNLQTIICEALVKRKKVKSLAADTKLPIDHVLDLNEEEAVSILLLLITNAYLKTSSLLSWMGYYLALEPDVQHKLKSELSTEKLSLADLSNLNYFQNVLRETLRCSKIVPYTSRMQGVDIEIKGNIIPANTPIIYAMGVVSEDSEFFLNPEVFNPDRYTSKNKPHSFACQFFGFAGNRKCPGFPVVSPLCATFYKHMLESFDLKLAPDQVVSAHYGLYVKPKEEIWLSIKSH